MPSKFLSRVAVASALIFAFTACGDDSGSGYAFDDDATTEETEDMAHDAIQLAASAIDQLNFDGPDIAPSIARAQAGLRTAYGARMRPSRLPAGITMPGVSFTGAGGIQLSAAPGCSTSSYGNDGDPWDYLDGNENGIADDWGLEYTCVTVDSTDLEHIRTQTNKLKITIKEDAASIYGYRVTQAYSSSYLYEGGIGYGGGYNAEEILDIRANAASHSVKYKSTEWEVGDDERLEWVSGASSDVDFTPDGTITEVDPLPDGAFVLSGRTYYSSSDDEGLSFTLETTDPLAFSAACRNDGYEPPFADGTLVGHLNGRSSAATFTIDFVDCGNYDIDTDNTSDEVVLAVPGLPRR